MILIVVKWPVRHDRADDWPDQVREFTDAVRAEPGNLFFEWSRSHDDPDTWVLVEGFRDADAGRAHVGSAHFRAATAWLPDAVTATPQIISTEIDASGWSEMAEVTPR